MNSRLDLQVQFWNPIQTNYINSFKKVTFRFHLVSHSSKGFESCYIYTDFVKTEVMHFIVTFLAFAIVINPQIGVVSFMEDGIGITFDNINVDLPTNSRTIRISGETWPKLDFLVDDANVKKLTQLFKKLPIVEAEGQIADFWKNFGKTSGAVKMESEVSPEEKTTVKPPALPTFPQVNSDNADKESSIDNHGETVDNSEDLTLVSNENGNPPDIGLRASQNAPENVKIPLIDKQGPPPYTPPQNEYINPGQFVYPSPQRVYYQPYNLNMPGTYPSQILAQPNLPFGYPQGVPVNQFYMPNNPYIIPQFYPGINLRGPPNYQPNINSMGAHWAPTLYPSYPNVEPHPAFGVPGQQVNI